MDTNQESSGRIDALVSERVDRTDEQGKLVGTSLVTTSDGAKWSDDYDLNDQWVGSSYRSTDGAWEDSRRINPPDVAHAQAPLSHAVETTGFWPDEGSYQRLDVFDTNTQLVYSSASYADGSTELYSLSDTAEGTTGTWTWTDANGDWDTWTENYDLNGQWVGSSHRSTDGAWEDSLRIDPPDVPHGQAPLSHAVKTTGSWPEDGSYERLEVFDTNDQLVYSSASYADGSTELYSLTDTADGTTGTWTLTDANGESSSSQEAFNTKMVDLAVDMTPWMRTATAQPFEPEPLVSTNASLRLNTPDRQDVTHASLTGKGDYSLRGNARNNVLVGNAGNNRINGGRGADMLTGGKGADQFVLRARKHSVDTITDFNPKRDYLVLKGEQFEHLFSKGKVRSNRISSQIKLDPQQQTLLVQVASENSDQKSWATLAILEGVDPSLLNNRLAHVLVQ